MLALGDFGDPVGRHGEVREWANAAAAKRSEMEHPSRGIGTCRLTQFNFIHLLVNLFTIITCTGMTHRSTNCNTLSEFSKQHVPRIHSIDLVSS